MASPEEAANNGLVHMTNEKNKVRASRAAPYHSSRIQVYGRGDQSEKVAKARVGAQVTTPFANTGFHTKINQDDNGPVHRPNFWDCDSGHD